MLDAATGDVLARVEPNPGAHNTNYGADGREVYLAGLRSKTLAVADTTSHKIVRSVGPFSAVIRPFTVNGSQTRAHVCVNDLLGFEIGDLKSGKALSRVEVQGFATGPVARHGCPSHGIGLTPDEKEVWVCDAFNRRMHVFAANGSGTSYLAGATFTLSTNTTLYAKWTPTLAGSAIVDNKSGGPVTVGTLVTYTVTFNEDMDAASLTSDDFDNEGTAAVTFGTVAETSPTSGVFTVQATPTGAGSLKLRIKSGAVVKDAAGNNLVVPVADDTTIIVQTSYEAWANSATFDADANKDGIKNGLAWLLGAANKDASALDKLPVASRSGGNLRLTFRCLKSAKRGGAVLKVQSSNDLGQTDPWASHETAVPDLDDIVNGVVFDTTEDGDFITVVADIPASGTKLFGRLHAAE